MSTVVHKALADPLTDAAWMLEKEHSLIGSRILANNCRLGKTVSCQLLVYLAFHTAKLSKAQRLFKLMLIVCLAVLIGL